MVSGRPARSAWHRRSSKPLPREGVGRRAHSETTQTPARGFERGLPVQQRASGQAAKDARLGPLLSKSRFHPDPRRDAVAATGFPATRPLSTSQAPPLGSLSFPASPEAGLRIRRRSGNRPQTSERHRRSESFSFEPSSRPCLLGLSAVEGPLQPLRNQERPRARGEWLETSVSIAVFHTYLPTLSPISAPNSDIWETRVKEKQLRDPLS